MAMPPLLIRRRDAARLLGLSEAQVRRLEVAGTLRTVQIPGMRATRIVAEDIERIAGRPIARPAAGGETPPVERGAGRPTEAGLPRQLQSAEGSLAFAAPGHFEGTTDD